MKLTYQSILDKSITTIYFKDRSGTVLFTKNPVGIHNIYILNSQGIVCFAGYVGWVHIGGLKKEVELIQTELCI